MDTSQSRSPVVQNHVSMNRNMSKLLYIPINTQLKAYKTLQYYNVFTIHTCYNLPPVNVKKIETPKTDRQSNDLWIIICILKDE